MTSISQTALPTTAIPLAPVARARAAESPAAVTGPAAANASLTGAPAYPAGGFGLTVESPADALRQQAAVAAANAIHWTPWQRAYSPDQTAPGNWINTST